MTATLTKPHRPTDLEDVRRVVESVPDPELPVLTLGQLGVIRRVALETGDDEAARVVVEITPT